MPLPDIDQFYNDLGKKIYEERVNKKITQEQLGDQLELTRLSIINLEKGRHRPSVYQLFQISEYLGISILKLLPKVASSKKNSNTTSKDTIRIITDQDQKLDKATKAFVDKIMNDLNK